MPTRCDARGDDAVAREGTEREASSGRRAREAMRNALRESHEISRCINQSRPRRAWRLARELRRRWVGALRTSHCNLAHCGSHREGNCSKDSRLILMGSE